MPHATQAHTNKLLLVTENENENLQGDDASLTGIKATA